MDLYHDFFYLYRELIRQLNVFDSDGNLRQRKSIEGEIKAALELMAS